MADSDRRGSSARQECRHEDSRTLLEQAVAVHAWLGARVWEAASRDALHGLAAASPPTVPGDRQVAVLRRERRGWTVAYGPEIATLPDSKAGGTWPCCSAVPTPTSLLELAQAPVQDAAAGAVADRTAIAASRHRLIGLEQDRADAERDNDPERLRLLDDEREAPLAAHLDRAVVTGTWCRYRSRGAPTWRIS